MTLTEFLLARIAEDEATARAASVGERWAWDGPDLLSDHVGDFRMPECIIDTEGANPPDPEGAGVHIARWDPARVLAECEAKRRIVEALSDATDENEHGGFNANRILGLLHAAHLLAAVYADHSDYREEWRP